jgi:hypothetical protein
MLKQQLKNLSSQLLMQALAEIGTILLSRQPEPPAPQPRRKPKIVKKEKVSSESMN